MTYVADAHGIIDPDNVLAPLQAGSCTYRIALGPRAGRKVLNPQTAQQGRRATVLKVLENLAGVTAGSKCRQEEERKRWRRSL